MDMNIKRIVDIFVNDGSILYKNNHYKAESTLLCLGGELEYTLPNSHYILIAIDDTDVDLNAIEIFSSKKAVLNNMVYGFLKYAEDNIPSLSPSSVKIPKGIRNDNGDAYTLVSR